MVGTLRGTKEAGSLCLWTLSRIQRTSRSGTPRLIGGDLEAATTGLVEGAVHGAKEMGVSVEEAAAAAVAGALQAAGKVGSTAVNAVRKAAAKPIHGVRAEAKAPTLAASIN